MSIPLTIDSSRVGNGTSDNFEVIFNNPINLQGFINGNRKYEIALVTADLWYTWHNITSSYANNTFRYHNGVGWTTITLPNGNYAVGDINDYLHDIMVANGDYTTVNGENIYDVNFVANEVTIKVRIEITGGYQVDLTTSLLNELIGFNQVILNTTTESPNQVDITRGVNNLLIHCSLVSGSYDNGTTSDILYSFTPNTTRGASIHVEPNNPIYVPMNFYTLVDRIKMRITDQQNRAVNFNNETVSYFLMIRPSKIS